MKVHVDNIPFTRKPTGKEIGGIKARFTKPESIRDITPGQLVDAIRAGYTVQPGVTPFSERSRATSAKGTVDADFTEQSVFFIDIDNKRDDIPHETPEHAAEALLGNNIDIKVMYPTFSDNPERRKFRIVVVCATAVTDRRDRDRIQSALIKIFPQSDPECINADRIFFGTDKGIIAEYTNPVAENAKEKMLAFADKILGGVEPESIQPLTGIGARQDKPPPKSKSAVIPQGERNATLSQKAGQLLKRYGDTEEAYQAFREWSAKCKPLLEQDELTAIYKSAQGFFNKKLEAQPGYIAPDEYTARNWDSMLGRVPTI